MYKLLRLNTLLRERTEITILKQKNKDKHNVSAVRNKGTGVLKISIRITLYFYCNYRGEAKNNFRIFHLVFRAVGLFACWAAQRSISNWRRRYDM